MIMASTSMPIKVSYESLTPEVKKEVDCLADNIYFESAHEPKEGQVAVAFVTLNRANSENYPDKVCHVVKQNKNKVCQFSWWCESKNKVMSTSKVLTKGDNKVYNEIRNLAVNVYMNYDKIKDPSRGALFYHADYVNPIWNRNMTVTNVIGRHIFYIERKNNG
jgi:N-acetylmuramoyl-L-alanine amidase